MIQLRERARRVDVSLDVVAEGCDALGRSYRETTHSVNISGGGLCFESQHALEIGSRLRLEIAVPPKLRRHFGGQAVYQARAVVCRVEKHLGPLASRVGVRFLPEAIG
jgi:hypothetical protein